MTAMLSVSSTTEKSRRFMPRRVRTDSNMRRVPAVSLRSIMRSLFSMSSDTLRRCTNSCSGATISDR